MTHLAGADMKASIVKAFKNDGCMEEIRSPRRRNQEIRSPRDWSGYSTHEIALSGDVNELVEEMDGLEVVDDDDENSDDEIDGDDWFCTYWVTAKNTQTPQKNHSRAPKLVYPVFIKNLSTHLHVS